MKKSITHVVEQAQVEDEAMREKAFGKKAYDDGVVTLDEQGKRTMDEQARRTHDSFQNFALRLGVGTDNPFSAGSYGFNPITRVRSLLEWIHRGSWLGGIAIDLPAEDMTRAGIEIQGEVDPGAIDDIKEAATATNIWNDVCDTIKWARLYGGCLAVAMVDGQNPATEFRPETVGKNAFKGLMVLDRWMVDPSLNDLVQKPGPHLGLPKYYTVMSTAPALEGTKIHYTRCMRLEGLKLPYWQRLQENLWGISILERLYDRMLMFDSATQGIAQLLYKSYLRTYKIKDLKEAVAAGAPAMAGIVAQIEFMRRYQSQEGITLMDVEDEFDIQSSASFAGMGDTLLRFGEQISGALQIPLVRLFGQSPAGMNATGESDLRTYYDGIRQQQVKHLQIPLTIVYQILARSIGVKWKDGTAIEFQPLWQLKDEERAAVAAEVTQTINTAVDSGLVAPQTGLKELKQNSRVTGIWSNITDEEINSAEELPKEEPEPGEQGAGLPGMEQITGQGKGGGGDEPPSFGGSEKKAGKSKANGKANGKAKATDDLPDDEKVTKDQVSFEHPAKGDDHCSQCHFWEGDGCGIVSGPVEARDWCDEFIQYDAQDSAVSDKEQWRIDAAKKAWIKRHAAGEGRKELPVAAPVVKPAEPDLGVGRLTKAFGPAPKMGVQVEPGEQKARPVGYVNPLPVKLSKIASLAKKLWPAGWPPSPSEQLRQKHLQFRPELEAKHAEALEKHIKEPWKYPRPADLPPKPEGAVTKAERERGEQKQREQAEAAERAAQHRAAVQAGNIGEQTKQPMEGTTLARERHEREAEAVWKLQHPEQEAARVTQGSHIGEIPSNVPGAKVPSLHPQTPLHAKGLAPEEFKARIDAVNNLHHRIDNARWNNPAENKAAHDLVNEAFMKGQFPVPEPPKLHEAEEAAAFQAAAHKPEQWQIDRREARADEWRRRINAKFGNLEVGQEDLIEERKKLNEAVDDWVKKARERSIAPPIPAGIPTQRAVPVAQVVQAIQAPDAAAARLKQKRHEAAVKAAIKRRENKEVVRQAAGRLRGMPAEEQIKAIENEAVRRVAEINKLAAFGNPADIQAKIDEVGHWEQAAKGNRWDAMRELAEGPPKAKRAAKPPGPVTAQVLSATSEAEISHAIEVAKPRAALLAKQSIVSAVPIGDVAVGGANRHDTYKVTFADGTHGVFKRWKPGMQYNIQGAEESGWDIAQLVGLSDNVTQAVHRQIFDNIAVTGEAPLAVGEQGAMLDFNEGYKAAADVDMNTRYDGNELAGKMAVHDYLIANTDRHELNWMVNPGSGHIRLIDNGLAFYPANGPRGPNNSFLRHAISDGIPGDPATIGEIYRKQWPKIEAKLKENGVPAKNIAEMRERVEGISKMHTWSDLANAGFGVKGAKPKVRRRRRRGWPW